MKFENFDQFRTLVDVLFPNCEVDIVGPNNEIVIYTGLTETIEDRPLLQIPFASLRALDLQSGRKEGLATDSQGWESKY